MFGYHHTNFAEWESWLREHEKCSKNHTSKMHSFKEKCERKKV